MNKNLLTLTMLTLISAPLLHAGIWGKKKEAKPKKDEVICIKKASSKDCIKACKKKGLNAAITGIMSTKDKNNAIKKCKKIENVCNCITGAAPKPRVEQTASGIEVEIEDVAPTGILLESLPPTR